MSDRTGLNRQLFWLYEGTGGTSYVFRWCLLVFDLVTIGYFLWAPFDSRERGHYVIDYVIGALILLDLLARFYITKHKHRFFTKWINWADMIVVLTMFAPLFVSNFAFMRILRAVRAVRAFTFIRRVKVLTPFFDRHERVIDKVTNLVVFVFIMAAVVYATQVGRNEDIHTYIDALYFTVTSLTTTGYGDVLLQGQLGRFISILVMVLGLSFFLQLLQAIVEPESKVDCECETCGLMRHDRDAVHCKHCGSIMRIETRGIG
ncbi:ion transporter [Henriciella litoralis]|uniref:ion transporter n=1 Tax=Henriciella litoralis TaxID=568102 RepID=UPI000A05A065|nr:ion transporter [Henriciella litoralis]